MPLENPDSRGPLAEMDRFEITCEPSVKTRAGPALFHNWLARDLQIDLSNKRWVAPRLSEYV